MLVLTPLLKYVILCLQHIKERGFEAMTHSKEDVQKTAQLRSIFMSLNGKAQDTALTILRALNFAQTVMNADNYEETRNTIQQ